MFLSVTVILVSLRLTAIFQMDLG